jgi:hypothetical protein
MFDGKLLGASIASSRKANRCESISQSEAVAELVPRKFCAVECLRDGGEPGPCCLGTFETAPM